MAAFEHLVKSYDIGDLLDDIASADPDAAPELEQIAGRVAGG